MKRKIIKIDEEKCNGCGQCVPDCAEGALQIIDGKARLVKESLCDGLGACLGNCPTGALIIEEREAAGFDEEEVRQHLKQQKPAGDRPADQPQKTPRPHQGCPGSMARVWENDKKEDVQAVQGGSALRQWPVQLKLLSPHAPYFKNADLLVATDCVPFSYVNFHERFLQDKVLVIFCPKLDSEIPAYIDKLAEIIRANHIQSISTVHMEVPCCTGTVKIVEEALKASGKNVVIKDDTVSIQGDIV
ncbi:MAG: ATP-binding protein [Candidatus Omnitrophota bacterium]